jgi:mannan endo-1,4-beta-mannosidase
MIYNFRKKIKLILAIIYFLNLSTIFTRGEDKDLFIRTKGNEFIRNGRAFKFIGASAVNLVFYDDWDLDIEKAIRTAKENNISVLRLYLNWGWGKTEDYDRIIDIASRYGIYVILTLTDCCCSGDYNSLEKYFRVHAPFCNITNQQCIAAFKKSIKDIIERKNSINGKIYRDDPTIFAWEIANELEYWNFSESDVRHWANEIANYTKAIDRNHLITIGINANYPSTINIASLNAMFNIPRIDFLSFHFYPKAQNLDISNLKLPQEDIQRLKILAEGFLSTGKPVILGEFGFSDGQDLNNKIKADKPEYYNFVFKAMMDTAFSVGASGVMFWGWGISEEKDIPMWWPKESHSCISKDFCNFIRKYSIPK